MSNGTCKLPELFDEFDDADIDRLMKRCQNGLGGRPSVVYEQANDLAAECYGAIGRLRANEKAYRARMEALVAHIKRSGGGAHTRNCDALRDDIYARLCGCTCGLDALLAACEREVKR